MSAYSNVQFCAQHLKPEIQFRKDGSYIEVGLALDNARVTLNLSPESYRELAKACEAAAVAMEGVRMNTTDPRDTVAELVEVLEQAKIAMDGVSRAMQDLNHARDQVNRTLAGIETQENRK